MKKNSVNDVDSSAAIDSVYTAHALAEPLTIDRTVNGRVSPVFASDTARSWLKLLQNIRILLVHIFEGTSLFLQASIHTVYDMYAKNMHATDTVSSKNADITEMATIECVNANRIQIPSFSSIEIINDTSGMALQKQIAQILHTVLNKKLCNNVTAIQHRYDELVEILGTDCVVSVTIAIRSCNPYNNWFGSNKETMVTGVSFMIPGILHNSKISYVDFAEIGMVDGANDYSWGLQTGSYLHISLSDVFAVHELRRGDKIQMVSKYQIDHIYI